MIEIEINHQILAEQFVPWDPWTLDLSETQMATLETPQLENAFPEGGVRSSKRRIPGSVALVDRLNHAEDYLDGADVAWRDGNARDIQVRIDDCLSNSFQAVTSMTDLLIDLLKILPQDRDSLEKARKIQPEKYQATRNWGSNMEQRIEKLQDLGVFRTVLAAQTVRHFGRNTQEHEHRDTTLEGAEIALSVAETYCQTIKHIIYSMPTRVTLRAPTANDWKEQVSIHWDPTLGRVKCDYVVEDSVLGMLRQIAELDDAGRTLHGRIADVIIAVEPEDAIRLSRTHKPHWNQTFTFCHQRDEYEKWLKVLIALARRPWRYNY